jgi:hypothetical protein
LSFQSRFNKLRSIFTESGIAALASTVSPEPKILKKNERKRKKKKTIDINRHCLFSIEHYLFFVSLAAPAS